MSTTQLDLAITYPRLPPFAVGSATSKTAATRAARSAKSKRELVYLWITGQGSHGATQREIAAALHLPRATVCPRIRELEGWQGLPVLIRKTPLVRQGCLVYVAVPTPQTEVA